MILKTKINGHKAQFLFKDVEMKNSSVYQLMLSANAKENILAEIERIDHDIELGMALRNLNHNLDEVLPIIRNSRDPKAAELKITERFDFKSEHVREFLDLELTELSRVNFGVLTEVLMAQREFYQGIINGYFTN